MSIQQDQETVSAVTVAGTSRSALIYDGTQWQTKNQAGTVTPLSSGGTVTTVSVANTNGLSGTVANPTTTPAITLAPTFTGIAYSSGSALAAAVAGNFPTLNQNTTGNAATVTTNANLTGPITSVGNATSIASQTGTGNTFAMSASPTFSGTVTTPAIAISNYQQVNAVTNIGLDNSGTTDNTAKFNTWLSSNSGKVVYFPQGTYLFGAGNTSVSCTGGGYTFYGDGVNSTFFRTSSATADIIAYTTNWYNTVSQIGFTTSVTRTAGYALNFGTTNYAQVQGCQFTGMYNTINIGGNVNYINNCIFNSQVNRGIDVSGSTNNSYISFCTWNAQGSIPANSVGINVTQCGSLLISDCDVISMASGLLLNPTSPNGVFSVQANNCFFDTCTSSVSLTGTGNIQRVLFDQCWLGDSTNGFSSTSTASTLPTGILFNGCIFYGNSANGILASAIQDFHVIGCTFSSCTTSGITVSASSGAVTKFRITGNQIGPFAGGGASTTGILINSGTYGEYFIQGNDVTGNTTNISDSGSVTGQGQKVIKDNLGHLIAGTISTTTVASAAINTTETIIVGGLNAAPIPANSLRVGSIVRATVQGTCTSTVANASTFTLRMGTAGTVADASFATAAVTAAASGTAVAFKAVAEFVVVTTGTTGTLLGNLTVYNTGITGIATNNITVVPLTVTATLNTTAANYIELTYKSAATTTTSTFSAPAYIEIIKS